MSKALECPCCEERSLRAGAFQFMPKGFAPPGACEKCVLPPPPPLGDGVPPFAWPDSVARIEALAAAVERDYEVLMDAVAAVADADVSFETVIRPLMRPPHYKTDARVAEAKFLQHCSTDAALRAAADAAGARFASLKAKGRTRADVYARVVAFCGTAERSALPAYESHFVDAIRGQFERSGLGLSAADQKVLQDLRDRDAAVCSEYKKNLAEDATQLFFDERDLAGLPETWLAERRRSDGKIKVTLKYPDLLPVLQSCDVAATRRDVSAARERDAYGNNLDLVAEGVALRKRIAGLLGKTSWASLATETRMSGSPEAIDAFTKPLKEKTAAAAAAEIERLRALKRADVGAGDAALNAWDVSYYSSRLLKEEYGVDHEAARSYFPLDHVVRTSMAIYQELLGLVFTELDRFDTWHPAVRCFRVDDAASGDKMGFFYLDLHPRDGKYGHAAIFHLLKRWGDQVPVDCMLCNLPAPTADGPALLRHSNVVTFFHEFGHIMHGICAEGDGNATTLAKCPRDFVEAPSQMLENWCWTAAGLTRLSRHETTGEPLPADLLAKMLAAKNVGAAAGMARQIYLASLDLAIHGEDPPADAKALQALVDRLRPEISLVANPPGSNMLRSFGHLMNQYSAAYYGYLWAEVLSADMFETRFAADPFDAAAGARYRKLVLAPGGVGKIADHLAGFLGRAPSQEAFLKSRGIAP